MNETETNGANEMNKVVYILPALISRLNRKVTKLNKRAAKLNLTPVSLKVNPDDYVLTIPGRDCNGNLTEPERKIRVDITGAPVVLNGWEYLGSITALSNGEVMISHKAPEAYRATPHDCDHCKKNRRRKVTVALRKIESGETVQVGRTCLADYLDDSDAVALADWLEKIDKVSDEEAGQDSYPDDDSSWGDSGEPETFSWMAMVAAIIRLDGFYRKEGGTRFAATNHYYRINLKGEPPIVPTDDDREAARQVVAWVRSLGDEVGYLGNLKASLAGDLIDWKAVGIATSASPAMKRATEKEETRIAKNAAQKEYQERYAGSEHFGEIKKRATFELTVTACRVYETESYCGPGYDLKTAVAMIDTEGNLAVWFASGAKNYKLGEVFQVKATPKKHGTDRDGNAQTILNRCAFPQDAEKEEE